VAAVAASLAPAVTQREIESFARQVHPSIQPERIERLFANTGIDQRHLARPVEWYATARGAGERNRLAAELALHHGAHAARVAMARAEIEPSDVDTIVSVSTTVVQSPALDVTLVAELGLRPGTRRVPLFGLASLGGVAGLGIAADLLSAGDGCVLVVCSEMSSLTFVPRRGDGMASVVTMALFSDGAAAAVLCPAVDALSPTASARPRVVGRHTTLVPDSAAVMGFDLTDDGLLWRLARNVPDLAREWTGKAVDDAVASAGWTVDDVDHVLIHPGGSRVLDAVEEALGLPADALHWSRDVMREHGNLSSATVLVVLERFMQAGPPPGRALLTAMGPGFAFEHVLMES
jgi:alkylresorcinol/alkylpyrone synthase